MGFFCNRVKGHALDADGPLQVLLEAGGTALVGAPALLRAGHQVLQVLGEVLVLVAEEIDLQRRVVHFRAVLPLGHAVPDPQHLHRGVVTRIHQEQEVLHEALAQERRHLSGEAAVVSQDDVEQHEEAVDGAGVLQADLDVQRRAGDGLPSRSDGEHAAPGQNGPPEPSLALRVIVDGGADLLEQRLGPVTTKL